MNIICMPGLEGCIPIARAKQHALNLLWGGRNWQQSMILPRSAFSVKSKSRAINPSNTDSILQNAKVAYLVEYDDPSGAPGTIKSILYQQEDNQWALSSGAKQTIPQAALCVLSPARILILEVPQELEAGNCEGQGGYTFDGPWDGFFADFTPTTKVYRGGRVVIDTSKILVGDSPISPAPHVKGVFVKDSQVQVICDNNNIYGYDSEHLGVQPTVLATLDEEVNEGNCPWMVFPGLFGVSPNLAGLARISSDAKILYRYNSNNFTVTGAEKYRFETVNAGDLPGHFLDSWWGVIFTEASPTTWYAWGDWGGWYGWNSQGDWYDGYGWNGGYGWYGWFAGNGTRKVSYKINRNFSKYAITDLFQYGAGPDGPSGYVTRSSDYPILSSVTRQGECIVESWNTSTGFSLGDPSAVFSVLPASAYYDPSLGERPNFYHIRQDWEGSGYVSGGSSDVRDYFESLPGFITEYVISADVITVGIAPFPPTVNSKIRQTITEITPTGQVYNKGAYAENYTRYHHWEVPVAAGDLFDPRIIKFTNVQRLA